MIIYCNVSVCNFFEWSRVYFILRKFIIQLIFLEVILSDIELYALY